MCTAANNGMCNPLRMSLWRFKFKEMMVCGVQHCNGWDISCFASIFLRVKVEEDLPSRPRGQVDVLVKCTRDEFVELSCHTCRCHSFLMSYTHARYSDCALTTSTPPLIKLTMHEPLKPAQRHPHSAIRGNKSWHYPLINKTNFPHSTFEIFVFIF